MTTNPQPIKYAAGLALTLGLLGAAQSATAANLYKADNNNALNLAGSWTNNAVPGAADVAIWDATVATPANATNVLGGSMTWSNLVVNAISVPVQINADGNTLSLTNMTVSGNNLVLNCGVNVYGNPATWVIGTSGGARQLTIGSALGGTGNIKQQYGILALTPGAGSLPATMSYSWSGSGKLDLGGNSQTLMNLGTPWAATGTVTNGSLTLSLSGGDFNPNPQGNNSVQDLSGLSAFTINNPLRNFSYNVGGSVAGTYNIYCYLAATGAGTNFLAVNSLNPGTGSAISSGTSPMSYLLLGKNTVINANTIQVAGYKGSGSILFKSGLANPKATLRGTNGVDRLPNWIVGTVSTGAYNEMGTNDFTGGTLDAAVTNLTVAQHIAGAANSITGVLTVDGAASSVDVLTATVAQKTSSGSPLVLGSINQLNGSVKVGTLTLGDNQGTAAGVNIQAGYRLVNGTLRAQTIQSGAVATGGAENTASYRTIFWTNGVIANYDANTDLALSGVTVYAPSTGTCYFQPDSGRTLGIQGQINQGSSNATPIIMNGLGTLDLAGTIDNSWLSLNVSNGLVLLDKASTSGTHALGRDFFINGGTVRLAGSGGDQIYDQRVAWMTGGAFDLYAQTETIAGLAGTGGSVTDTSGGMGTLTLNVAYGTNFAFGGTFASMWNLVKTGAGKETFYGTDQRTSANDTVNQGILEIGNGNGTGTLASSVTVNAAGTLSFNRSGTFNFAGTIGGTGSVAQNGPGTLILSGADSHTGSTLVNTGTLALGSGATSIGGSTVTVQSGATFDVTASSGNFALGYGQSLVGLGTVQGSLLLGSGSTLSSNLTINGSVTALDGSTNIPGATFVAGTITVNGSFTNSGNNYWVYDLANVTNAGGGINPLLVVSGNLDLGNPNNANTPTLILHGTPVSGRYTLATFGSFSGNASALVVVGSTRYTYTPHVVGNTLVLDVTGNGGNLVWRGDGLNNYWNVDPNNLDWFNLATSAADAFNPGDNVVFNDTSANTTVLLNASVLPASVTVNATTNYTFADAGGSIDGPVALTKTNSGTLTVQVNNSFSGPVNLNGGTLSVSSVALNGTASPLGSGSTLAFNGGTWQYTGSSVPGSGFNRLLTLGANGGTIDQESVPGTFLFLTNLISGPGSLVKTGAQQLIIGDVGTGAGNNTYSGITYVQAGQLQIRNTNALGSTAGKTVVTDPGNVAAGGALQGTIAEPFDLSGYGGGNGALQAQDNGTLVTFAGAINLVTNAGLGGISSGASMSIAGPLSGPGALTKLGVNTLTFLNTPTYTGGTTISNGVLQLGTNSTSGWLPPQPAGVALTNYGTLVFNRSDTNTYASVITGTGGVRQNGTGTTILAAANSFSGNVNINASSLRAAANSALGMGNVYLAGGNGVATLELAGNCSVSNNLIQLPMHNAHTPAQIRNVSGTNVLQGLLDLEPGGATWDISSDGGYLDIQANLIPSANCGGGWRTVYLNGTAGGRLDGVYDQSLINPPANVLLEVTGGTWTLGTNNNYGGQTTIDSGATLLADNTNQATAGSATGTGAVVVNGTLGGNGYISGPVSINSGGTLSPGDGIGTLTLSGNLTLAGGNLYIEVNKALTQPNDSVVVAGVLTNTAAGTITVTNLGTALTVGDKFTLFSQPVLNGGLLSIVGGGTGVTWANNLAVDGSISVASITTPPTSAPAPTGVNRMADGNFSLTVTGAVGSAWSLHATNWVSAPRPWPVITNGTITVSPFTLQDLKATNYPQRFYYFSAP